MRDRFQTRAAGRGDRFCAIVLLLAAGGALGGCIAAGENEEYVEGRLVSGQTMQALSRPGTTEAEVVGALGPPTRSIDRPDGSRLLVYDSRRTNESSGHFLLLFSGEDRTTVARSAYFEIRGDQVVSAWVDDERNAFEDAG